MPYGLIACFTTKPGQRDTVAAQLTTAGRELSALGCHQYIAGAACGDEVTVWVSEAWESRQHHDDSLRHDATRQSICQAPWPEECGPGCGRGWANNPGSVSTRMPRLASRFSLERMFSVFLAAIGRSRATHRSRARRGRPRPAKAVRICWVSGVIGERWRWPGRLCRRPAVVLPGEGDEGLPGDLQVADRLVELAEPGGELADPGLDLPGLAGKCLLSRFDLVQQVPAGLRGRGHAGRHDGADVPVSRRVITPVIAQYTRDAELESRCSQSRTRRRRKDKMPSVCSTTQRFGWGTKPRSAGLRSTTPTSMPTVAPWDTT